MVNMGGRDIDGFKKSGHKIETVFGNIKEVLVPEILIPNILALYDIIGKVKTNLL